MFISIFGYLFIFMGLLILLVPLILVELSRPKDWLMGGLFLFLGLFLLVENEFLRGSINLLVVSMAILFGKMSLEIFQYRWYQLSPEEIKRIGSFQRWFESFSQLGQSLALLRNGLINLFTNLTNQSEKSQKEKKWVHPKLKEEAKNAIDSNKLTYQESSKNEETS